MDGALLWRASRESGPFTSPSKPLYFLASIWTDAARNFAFGGRLDYGRSPFHSTIADLATVSCLSGLAYNGPNWAYVGTPAATAAALALGVLASDGTPALDGAPGRAILESGRVSGAEGGAGAAPGQGRRGHGAYLGCFNASKMGLPFGRAISLTPETAFRCADHCRGLRMPLYALSRALRCTCTARVPPPDARARDRACEALPAGASGEELLSAVPVFYIHGDASASCAVEAPPLNADSLPASYNPQNALYDTGSQALTLRLQGDEGVRVAGGDAQLYGMFSFRARVSAAPGVITAAYVSAWAGSRGARGGGRVGSGAALSTHSARPPDLFSTAARAWLLGFPSQPQLQHPVTRCFLALRPAPAAALGSARHQ
jgi:hypothetical protein